MNKVRITIVVQEMDDDEAMTLKKDIQDLLKPNVGATVTITLRPSITAPW